MFAPSPLFAVFGAVIIAPQDALKAPLVIGRPKVEVDKEGPFLCGAVGRGPGALIYVPLKIEGARKLVIAPQLEVRNPFGDRADWVGVDISFDGARYEPLAWVKGHLGRRGEVVKFDKPLTVNCAGRRRLFLRIRIGPWWYRKFPRFRGLRIEAIPEGATVEVDKSWTRADFLAAFRKARKVEEKPAPHVIYLSGPVGGILLWERLARREPVDAILGLAGVSVKGWTKGEIVGLAEVLEALGIPFMLRAGVPGAVATSPEVVREVFRAAPSCCRGLFAGEVWNSGVAYKKWEAFVDLLEIARQNGKKFAWFEHGRDGPYGLGWWGWCMEHPDIFVKVFDRRFHDVLVPMHENNDPRSQMPNLGMVLGVWLQGLVDEWGASVQTWWWNDVGYGPPRTCPPELITRMMLLYMALGATWFEIEPPEMFLSWDERGMAARSKQWRGLEAAYRLLAEGRMRIPKRGEVASIAPIGFRLTKGRSGYSIFDPQPWLKELPPVYAPRRLYSEERFGEELIPVTKYGFLPLFAPHAPVPKGFKAFETAGGKLTFEGEEVDPKRMEEIVAWRTREMPFTSPNACVVAWREGRGYKLLLLHPEEREPGEMRALVGQRVKRGVLVLRDVLTGEEFKAVGGVAGVPLSGKKTFRLLSAPLP